jgi:hypothetical protein
VRNMGRRLSSAAPEKMSLGRALRRALWVIACSLLIALGVLVIGVGGVLIASAHSAHPVAIDGSIADYKEILVNGSYARNDLQLVDDNRTFTLDTSQFHPTLPERLMQYGKIQIWVDDGTTSIVAITLYDQLGLNPTTYSSDVFDHPVRTMVEGQVEGAVTSGSGLALIIVTLVLLRRGGPGRKKPVPLAAPAGTSPERPQLMPASWEPPGQGTDGQGGLDQIPTQKTPAVPILAGDQGQPFAASAASAASAAHDASAPSDLDQLPTDKSPALSSMPPPDESSPMPMPRFRPTEPPLPMPRFRPTEPPLPVGASMQAEPPIRAETPLPMSSQPQPPASVQPPDQDIPWGVYWGAAWEPQSPARDESPAHPASQPPSSWSPPAPDAVGPVGPISQPDSPAANDIEELPTQKTPALAPGASDQSAGDGGGIDPSSWGAAWGFQPPPDEDTTAPRPENWPAVQPPTLPPGPGGPPSHDRSVPSPETGDASPYGSWPGRSDPDGSTD